MISGQPERLEVGKIDVDQSGKGKITNVAYVEREQKRGDLVEEAWKQGWVVSEVDEIAKVLTQGQLAGHKERISGHVGKGFADQGATSQVFGGKIRTKQLEHDVKGFRASIDRHSWFRALLGFESLGSARVGHAEGSLLPWSLSEYCCQRFRFGDKEIHEDYFFHSLQS